MKKYFYPFLLLFPCLLAAQKRQCAPFYADVLPRIDGLLDDSIWARAVPLGDFTTSLPYFGRTPQAATTVRVLQTRLGLAFAVTCGTRVLRADGSIRDALGTADYISIGLDTWDDDQNAFVFSVTASGQMADWRVSSTATEPNYDTKWRAKVRQAAQEWTAEIFVPFTALRYSKHKLADWGLQFMRYDRSSGELSTWNPQDPLITDQVLQYGSLGPLGVVQFRQRMTANLISGVGKSRTYLEDVDFEFEDARASIILDGQIGIGSASTLGGSMISGGGLVNTAIREDTKFEDFEVEIEPRQLWAEENGTAEKSALYEGSLNFNRLLGPVIPPFFPSFRVPQYKPFNTVRYTTRNKNNTGFSISNDLYQDREVLDGAPPSELYSLTNVNQLAVERACRNNSWVQFSNTAMRIGPGRNTNISSLNTQWHDKANRLSFEGAFNLGAQFVDESVPTSIADGRVAVRGINRRVNWGLSYQSPRKVHTGVLIQDGALREHFALQRHVWSARVSRRNFTTQQGFWLNTQDELGLDVTRSLDNYEVTPVLLHARRRATDRRFREWTIGLQYGPLRDESYLNINETYFLQTLPQRLGADLSVSTDSRKKYGASTHVNLDWNFLSPAYHRAVEITVFGVPEHIIRIGVTGRLEHDANTRIALGDPNLPNGVLQSDIITRNIQTNLNIYLTRHFAFVFDLAWSDYRITQKEAFVLSSNGYLEPQENYVFVDGLVPSDRSQTSMGLGTSIFMRRGSQLRFTYETRLDSGYRPSFLLFPSAYDYFQDRYRGFNLALILNLTQR
jgi:hypothetical protein